MGLTHRLALGNPVIGVRAFSRTGPGRACKEDLVSVVRSLELRWETQWWPFYPKESYLNLGLTSIDAGNRGDSEASCRVRVGFGIGGATGEAVWASGVTNWQKICFPASRLQALCLPALPTLSTNSQSFLKIDLKLIHVKKTKNDLRTSLAFQWLRVCASNAGGTALIPAWGSHMLCRREEVNIVFDENKKIII